MSSIDNHALTILQQFKTNVNHAAFNRETVVIGGGQFDAKELKEMVDYIYEYMANPYQLVTLKELFNHKSSNLPYNQGKGTFHVS
jgi:hypothetical protein